MNRSPNGARNPRGRPRRYLLKSVTNLVKVAVCMALLGLLATGCNVEREWISSRDPSEAEAQEEMQEQAAFYDIEGGPELDAAAREYQQYVNGQSELLVDRTEEFVTVVKAGDLEEAKELYAPSRVPWERIEPIAEKFGTLDPEVDAREGDVPDRQWTGFHRIEKALWIEKTTEGQGEYADELMPDVERLERKVDAVKLQASDPVFGAVELLNEVSATKITGEEERYSHTDLYDIAANVEGAEVAFEFVKPVVKRESRPRGTDRGPLQGPGTGDGILSSRRRLGQLREGRRGAAASAQPEDRRPRRTPLQGRSRAERDVARSA
jgi:iron uptake system component EfeO